MAHRKDHPTTFSEHRMLLDDAQVLLDRYKLRNEPGRRLTPDQRRAWAAEVVDVMEQLRRAVAMHIGPPDWRADRERREAWLHQFATGFRPVKPIEQDPDELRPRPPYWKRNGQG